MKRKIVQIAFEPNGFIEENHSIGGTLHILTNDGKIFCLDKSNNWQEWELPELPQDDFNEVPND